MSDTKMTELRVAMSDDAGYVPACALVECSSLSESERGTDGYGSTGVE